jgi:tRNA nucleotidyltransferase/poly(A) polymerase
MIISDSADEVFRQMFDAEILAEIMPGAIFDLALLNGMNPESNLRYAALLHNTRLEILQKLLDDLGFSKSDKKQIINLILFRQKNNDLSSKNLLELKNIFYPLWVENMILEPYIFISKVDKNKNFDELMKVIKNIPPKFPMNGDDLKSLDIEGKDIGMILAKLKLKWIESDFALSKKDLEMMIIFKNYG